MVLLLVVLTLLVGFTGNSGRPGGNGFKPVRRLSLLSRPAPYAAEMHHRRAPGFVEPMLLAAGRDLPSDHAWRAELKLAGTRLRPSTSVEDSHFPKRLFGGERRNKPDRCGQSV